MDATIEEIFEFLGRPLFPMGDQQIIVGQLPIVPTLLVVGYLLTRWLSAFLANHLTARNVNPDLVHLVRRIDGAIALLSETEDSTQLQRVPAPIKAPGA